MSEVDLSSSQLESSESFHQDDLSPLHKKKHDDGESIWLISYSDMMTLLMGFFALMLSMSTLDQEKIDLVRKNAAETFGGEYQERFEQVYKELKEIIKEKKLENHISLSIDKKGLTLVFTGSAFFDSGSIQMKSEIAGLMDAITPVITTKAAGYQILFEGHTDNVPIHHPYIQSNWDLSGLRASSLARYAITKGLPAENVMILGWGEMRPEKPNLNTEGQPIPENQALNRRVIIKILREPII